MSDDLAPHPGLLPAGFGDLLPPDAEIEAATVEALMRVFAVHGYQRVKPPLLEFEESFLSGSGAAVAEQTFRIMDPDSHRMMALRSDTTPQVARIATTRLASWARPLRLSYAGQCLRVRASQLAPDRQVAQAGIELIGVDSPAADAELVLVAAEALRALGLGRTSFDLTLPPLVPAVLEASGIAGPARSALVRALDRKDAAAVKTHGAGLADMLIELLLSAGPADRALATLAGAALPEAGRPLAERLAATVEAIRARAPELRLTIDPIEFRGFRYHTGVCMTVYAPGRHEELGRGGRYLCGEAEPATGVTLYPDAMLRAAPTRAPRVRVYVPLEADPAAAQALRREGCATVAALSPVADVLAEARQLGCAHVLIGDRLRAVPGDQQAPSRG